MNKRLKITKKFIYIGALVLVVLFSVGFSALQSSLSIVGDTRYNRKFPVRITGIVINLLMFKDYLKYLTIAIVILSLYLD